MKTKKSFFAILAFLMAIGSAFASEYLLAAPAWTKKIDVPGQTADCVKRLSCSGSGTPCSITFLNQNVIITVPAYDGATQNETTCGERLMHTP
jgi:hypothetical protein